MTGYIIIEKDYCITEIKTRIPERVISIESSFIRYFKDKNKMFIQPFTSSTSGSTVTNIININNTNNNNNNVDKITASVRALASLFTGADAMLMIDRSTGRRPGRCNRRPVMRFSIEDQPTDVDADDARAREDLRTTISPSLPRACGGTTMPHTRSSPAYAG